jgi:oxygen-independent coproporphyrinogen III oxidase
VDSAWSQNWRNGFVTLTLGIYFHIPFCLAKCSYCHFVSMPFEKASADRYCKIMIEELTRCVNSWADAGDVDSIYFGGGTPSLIPAEHIVELLASCRRLFCVAEDCEVSLEANPDTLSPDKVTAYRRSGVNRISIGAQTFHDRELSRIGRLHTAEMITEALLQLRTGGFRNINLDLMLGLPGQTATSWRGNLEKVVHWETPHISVYMLDLDDACPMRASVDAGSLQLPDEDLVSDLYLETVDFLSRYGYGQYEISNFSLPGHACWHNLKYWQRDPVCGVGLASHSFNGQYRYSNCSQLDDYIDAVCTGKSPVFWREKISVEQSLSESLFLGLRLTQGVDWDRLRDRYGWDRLAIYETGMQELTQRGLVQWEGSTVRLTASGMLLSNEVFQLFI